MPPFARLLVPAALLLASCGTGAEFAAAPPTASGSPAEQARLRLIDKCMFDPATNAGPADKKGKTPLCQCYAQALVRQMSSSDAASYAASGHLPWSVKSDEAMASCRKR